MPLDVTAQADNEVFPGTIWVAVFNGNSQPNSVGNITILTPTNPVICSGIDSFSLDDDGDGYSNADENDAGTDPCNAASLPIDFDIDFLSDVNDVDDDNDGLEDDLDILPLDAENGLTTFLPIEYELLNADPGFGLFGLGFTGFMHDLESDYLDFFVDETNSGTEIVAGGAVGALTFNPAPLGSALGGENSQQNAFQFGVNIQETTPPFTLLSELALLDVLGSDGSIGVYLGDGSQDNYVSLSVANNGVRFTEEINGDATIEDYEFVGINDLTTVNLYLSVDPSTATIQPRVSLDGGAQITLSEPRNLGDTLANVIQGAPPVAVGIIADNPEGVEFSATWDSILISYDDEVDFSPEIEITSTTHIASITSGDTEILTVTLTNPSGSDLTIGGVSLDDPSFTLVEPIQSVIGAGQSADIQVLFDPGVGGNAVFQANLEILTNSPDAPVSTVIISGERAEDFGNPQEIIYAINSGGPSYTATSGITYSADQLFTGGGTFSTNNQIAGTDDDAIYQSERFGTVSYNLPLENGEYDVTLHFAEIFANQSNSRIFSVNAEEEEVVSNLDLFDVAGHDVAHDVTFTASVVDGSLDLDLISVLDNAKISGILVTRAEVEVSNIALGGVASQSSTRRGGFPDRAIDGDVNGGFQAGSVTHTAPFAQPWWQVDLGEISSIQSLEIWNRTDGNLGARLSDFAVFITDEDASQRSFADLQADPTVWRYNHVGVPGALTEIPVNSTGRFVKVQLPGSGVPLSLAEVVVLGGVAPAPSFNVSQGKPASQITTRFSGFADRAVDGDVDGNFQGGSVTHTTNTTNPWWVVDLGSQHRVDTVEVWNRVGSAGLEARLSDFTVFVSDNDPTGLSLEELLADPNVFRYSAVGVPEVTTLISVGGSGRYVRVQLTGSNRTLSLAEVIVMGDEL